MAKDFEKLSEIIPQTFGEAVIIYPWIDCEPHEWDNRTTIENTQWIINELCVMADVEDTSSGLHLADVSQQREPLIDFSQFLLDSVFSYKFFKPDKVVDFYLKSINGD